MSNREITRNAIEYAQRKLHAANRQASGGIVIWHRLSPEDITQIKLALREALDSLGDYHKKEDKT